MKRIRNRWMKLGLRKSNAVPLISKPVGLNRSLGRRFVTGAAVENFPAGRSDKLPSDAMYFPWFLMADKRSEFDFPSWVAKPVLPHSFYGCVRSAADILALGRGGLRSRLYNALFCLCFCDGRDVPKSLQADFDSVRHEIQRRAGAAEDG